MMRANLILTALAAFIALTCYAQAQQHNEPREAPGAHGGAPHGAPARAGHPEPRSKGVPQFGAYHRVTPHAGKPLRTQVFLDRRSHVEIQRDPHVIVFNHTGWKPRYQWTHWNRDWGTYWRFQDWSDVQTVTCEAVDTQTEQLFPVTETRVEGWVWSSDLVNNVASRSLDECAAETGTPENCALVERECWNSVY